MIINIMFFIFGLVTGMLIMAILTDATIYDYFNRKDKKWTYVLKKKRRDDIIYFTIDGKPKPLQRHRHHGKRTYDPSKKDKKDFLLRANKYKPDKPLQGAIVLGLLFYIERSKSHYRSGKYRHLKKKKAPKYHTNTPDLDNLIKLVSDALNGVFYKDDSQIMLIKAEKHYASNIEKPKTVVMIDKDSEEIHL